MAVVRVGSCGCWLGWGRLRRDSWGVSWSSTCCGGRERTSRPGATDGPPGPATPREYLMPRRSSARGGSGGAGAAGWGGLGGRDGRTRAGGMGLATTRLPAFPPRPPPFSTHTPGGLHDGIVMRRAAGLPVVAEDGLRVCVPPGRRDGGFAPFGAAVYAARAVRDAPDRGPSGFLWLLVEDGRRTSKFLRCVLAEHVFWAPSCPGATGRSCWSSHPPVLLNTSEDVGQGGMGGCVCGWIG